MVTRNVHRPAYALALLFAIVAIADAANAIVAMQTTRNGGNAGWVIDLAAAAISAGFATVLLMRPHFYVFAAEAVWALIAFVVNFALRQPDGIDGIATYRMVIYFIVFVASVVLVADEAWERMEPQRAVRGAGVRPWAPMNGPATGSTPPYVAPPSGPMAVQMAPAPVQPAPVQPAPPPATQVQPAPPPPASPAPTTGPGQMPPAAPPQSGNSPWSSTPAAPAQQTPPPAPRWDPQAQNREDPPSE